MEASFDQGHYKCEKQLVLLCFHSKILKTFGFIVFSLKSIEKALVVLCFRSKRLKNQWFYCKNAKKVGETKKNWFYC